MTKGPINKMNNLQLLLSTKSYTLKELYAEVVLIMCHSLLANYLYDEEKNKELNENDIITPEENKLINDLMKEVFSYLNKEILTYSEIQVILQNAKELRTNEVKARLVEPYAYFYNVLANSFIARLNYVNEKEEKKKYIPDLLVVSLIFTLKEKVGGTMF